METLIKAYLDAKSKVWSSSTLVSESSRLMAVVDLLASRSGGGLWEGLVARKLSPYSRTTLWTRVTDFHSFTHPSQPNPYQQFRQDNPQLFRNSYVKRTPSITFERALELINDINDLAIRRKALELLGSGLRYQESTQQLHKGHILGKGGKSRKVFIPKVAGPVYTGSHATFWRALRRVGLKPHDLRKLCATQAVQNGATSFELCALFGWSSVQTAMSYIHVNEERIKKVLPSINQPTKPQIKQVKP